MTFSITGFELRNTKYKDSAARQMHSSGNLLHFKILNYLQPSKQGNKHRWGSWLLPLIVRLSMNPASLKLLEYRVRQMGSKLS
jgi:hypothetical protein